MAYLNAAGTLINFQGQFGNSKDFGFNMKNTLRKFVILWTILIAWKKKQIFDMQFEFETDFGQVAFWHDDHDDMTFIRGRLL